MLTAKFCVFHFDLFNVTWALVNESSGKYHVTIGKPEMRPRKLTYEEEQNDLEPGDVLESVNTIVSSFYTNVVPTEHQAIKYIGAL